MLRSGGWTAAGLGLCLWAGASHAAAAPDDSRTCWRGSWGFAGFDFHAVARFGAQHVERLLDDASIVRHRGKIESTINNARRAIELVEAEGSLAAYVWRYEPAAAERPTRITHESLHELAQTDASRALAKDLKRRGWTFVGPTTVYAFMQAMGLVNDHLEGCDARARVEAARASWRVRSL